MFHIVRMGIAWIVDRLHIRLEIVYETFGQVESIIMNRARFEKFSTSILLAFMSRNGFHSSVN